MSNKFLEKIPQEIKENINEKDYDFFNEVDKQHKIVYLTMGGSWSYGTNIQTSDVDLRGVALESPEEILSSNPFEQFIEEKTDTTIYSITKFIKLILTNNPNILEMVGTLQKHRFVEEHPMELILNNMDRFISKKVFFTFGNYAANQLRRLANKEARSVSEEEKTKYIKNSIKGATEHFRDRYGIELGKDIILTAGKTLDINIKSIPTGELASCLNEIATIVKDYTKLGKRNKNAVEKGKLNKHSMHLVRLYLMAIDILKTGEIHTYQDERHDFLMDIRNGKYLADNSHVTGEFMTIVDKLEEEMKKAYEKSKILEKPDVEFANKLILKIRKETIEKSLKGLN